MPSRNCLTVFDCLSLMWATVLVFKRRSTFVYCVISGKRLTVNQDQCDLGVSNPARWMSAIIATKCIFTDWKSLQILQDCGQKSLGNSWKPTGSRICWSLMTANVPYRDISGRAISYQNMSCNVCCAFGWLAVCYYAVSQYNVIC